MRKKIELTRYTTVALGDSPRKAIQGKSLINQVSYQFVFSVSIAAADSVESTILPITLVLKYARNRLPLSELILSDFLTPKKLVSA